MGKKKTYSYWYETCPNPKPSFQQKQPKQFLRRYRPLGRLLRVLLLAIAVRTLSSGRCTPASSPHACGTAKPPRAEIRGGRPCVAFYAPVSLFPSSLPSPPQQQLQLQISPALPRTIACTPWGWRNIVPLRDGTVREWVFLGPLPERALFPGARGTGPRA